MSLPRMYRRRTGCGLIATLIVFLCLGGAGAHAAAPAWPSGWQSATPAPEPRFESAAIAVGGRIYSFGAFSDSEFRVNRSYVSYDPATDTWTSLGTLPSGMAETHLGLATDGRYVYLAGGFGGDLQVASPSQWITDKVWRYDTATNTWLQIATLPQARGAGGLDLVGRKLHYISGNPADRVTNVPEHFVYDLDTRQWSTAAPFPDPKDHFSTAVIGNKIYVIGGEYRHDQLHLQQSSVHVYDATTDTWTQLADLPMAKSHTEGGTFVSQGKIIMAGGQVDNFQPTGQVVSYDPATNAWTTLTPSLPVTLQGAIVQRIGQQIVLAMGALQTDQPQTRTWTGGLPLPPAPSNTAAPSAGGKATRGVAQKGQAGTWTGATSVGEQWQRCSDPGDAGTCADIAGATSLTYTPGSADVGQYLRLVEAAANEGGSSTAASAMTLKVSEPPAPKPPLAPVPRPPIAGAPAPTAPTACASSRTVTVRWSVPGNRRLRTVVLRVNGVPATILRGNRRGLALRLHGLPKRNKLTIRARTAAGETLQASRTYSGCKPLSKRRLLLRAVK
jgi:N-acetylneuraminic acid mutarotase